MLFSVLVWEVNIGYHEDRRVSSGQEEGPLVSLNRFERKKNLPLAVEALGWAMKNMGAVEGETKSLRLVIAGGYDERVAENVEHLEELEACVAALGLEEFVEFRRNIGDDERSTLLRTASCVLYTPSNEHFGIVPVEAMCSGAPVIAVNSGGPIETVVDGTTGFLCDPTAQSFGSAIVKLARDPELAVKMGIDGQRRVHDKFSMESFAGVFESSLKDVASAGHLPILRWLRSFCIFLAAYLGGWAASSAAAKEWQRRSTARE